MTSILIADRDENERIGIRWLISSNTLPISRIDLASTFNEVIQIIEEKNPDIACIELDMIPKEKWGLLKIRLSKYVRKIIFLTAEATFEKAMQAIEAHVEDLWVKPVAANHMLHTLKGCIGAIHQSLENNHPTQNTHPEISYLSLFSEQESHHNDVSLLFIQREDKKKTLNLHLFLQKLNFQYQTNLFPLSELIVCVVKETNPTLLKLEGTRILKAWEDHDDEPLAIVVFSSSSKKPSIHEKYKLANKALELTFYKGYRQVICVNEEIQWIPLDPFLSSKEQREWMDMLHSGKREKIKAWMYTQFLMLSEPFPDPGLLRIRLTSILAQIRRYMKTYELEKKAFEVNYHQIFELILYNPVLYRIVQELLLFIFDLLDGANEQKNNSQLNVVDVGILYIEEHFSKRELTLDEVANFVDRSPAYFSHVLSAKIGITFKQFLTKTRIREAEKLLRETKLSVQQISTQSGFKNANYFSRIFKNIKNMTPTEYRLKKRT